MSNPTLASVIDEAIRTRLRGLRVGMPARVVAYDNIKQRVSVQPCLHEAYTDLDTGARMTEPVAVIVDVPVQFPQGGGYRITFPIAVNDYGWLQFADRSLDSWLARGGVVDPVDDREHALSDAVFYPGVRPFAAPLASAPTDCMSVGKDSGPVIEIDGSEIRVGGAGAVALATKADIDNIRTWLINHVHAGAVTGANCTGSPAILTPPVITGTSVAKGK